MRACLCYPFCLWQLYFFVFYTQSLSAGRHWEGARNTHTHTFLLLLTQMKIHVSSCCDHCQACGCFMPHILGTPNFFSFAPYVVWQSVASGFVQTFTLFHCYVQGFNASDVAPRLLLYVRQSPPRGGMSP